jgi:hypothetical protein
MQIVAGGEERLVTMIDGCDPESFDAADVTCVRPGGVTLERFLDLLAKHGTVGAWRFSSGTLHASVGQTLLAVNRGGEGLNLAPGDFVSPWASHTDEVEEPETEHYQCCIHPWMRLDLQARP